MVRERVWGVWRRGRESGSPVDRHVREVEGSVFGKNTVNNQLSHVLLLTTLQTNHRMEQLQKEGMERETERETERERDRDLFYISLFYISLFYISLFYIYLLRDQNQVEDVNLTHQSLPTISQSISMIPSGIRLV